MKFAVNIKELKLRTSTEEKVLLKDIAFNLEENCIYTILGKNGSGKSTLIKSLAGLLNSKFYSIKGSIIADNIDITTATKEELIKIRKEKIKYVFQDAINSFDPLRKLGYYFKRFGLAKGESENLLSYFLLPPLNELSKMYPYELSGGMAQRVSFVITLLMNPELLILDEPTSGIDTAIANLFLLKIREFITEDRKSVLLVTQDIEFAKSAGGFIAHIDNEILTRFKLNKEYFNSGEVLFKNRSELR
jgi:ABC-type glutathione transport system ATPase component